MKRLANSYALENRDSALSRDEYYKIFTDFKYFMANYAQIVGKDRRLHNFKLNPFQEYLFRELLPLIKKETRLERNLSVCVAKPRQVGCSVGIIAFINYICAFLDDFENTSILMVEPVADTISKLYTKKVEPILTGIHPEIMPTMERETMGTSILTHYNDIMGVRRNNFFELVSSGASSIRSDTVNIVIFDEAAFYSHPEVVADAAVGSMPDTGFSLTIYMSTFEDRKNDFFKDKLRTAMDNPDDWKILFAPWFIQYPEKKAGVDYNKLALTEYDQEVIIPEMAKYGIPAEEWGDHLKWYHTKEAQLVSIKKEFPTTLEEILAIGEDKSVFTPEPLQKQEQNVLPDKSFRLVTDTLTNKSELHADENGPFMVYVPPRSGHKYMLLCDPISSNSDESDYYAASIFDLDNNEQAATLYIRGLPVEDLADLTAGLATIYNRAQILPETNLSQALVACIRAKGYFNFYYADKLRKAKKEPGIRTTVSSKPAMIDKLQLMLDNGRIVIHSKETLRQLKAYAKIVKKSGAVSFSAPKGDHDDAVIPLLLYAGSKTDRELAGKSGQGYVFL